MIRRNPFSSRFVRPGAMPFIAPPGCVESMVEIVATGGRWAIVGPHGTGKTTLLCRLRDGLRRRGIDSRWYGLHDAGRRRRREGRGETAFIDGYEQLPIWEHWRWRFERKLVITSHRPPPGFEVLRSTAVDDALAEAIVAHLVSGEVPTTVTPDEASAVLRDHGGNMRDALIALYRRHEAARGGYGVVS